MGSLAANALGFGGSCLTSFGSTVYGPAYIGVPFTNDFGYIASSGSPNLQFGVSIDWGDGTPPTGGHVGIETIQRSATNRVPLHRGWHAHLLSGTEWDKHFRTGLWS